MQKTQREATGCSEEVMSRARLWVGRGAGGVVGSLAHWAREEGRDMAVDALGMTEVLGPGGRAGHGGGCARDDGGPDPGRQGERLSWMGSV